jgi:hypothetical protein
MIIFICVCYYRKMNVYAILAQGELLPNYFNTYKKALDEVKKLYPNWDDGYDEYALNKVAVEEGHKINKHLEDANITELYIEKGINIYIHKLVVDIEEVDTEKI